MAHYKVTRHDTEVLYQFDWANVNGFIEVRRNAYGDMIGKASLNGMVTNPGQYEYKIVRTDVTPNKVVKGWNDNGEAPGKPTWFYDYRVDGWGAEGMSWLVPAASVAGYPPLLDDAHKPADYPGTYPPVGGGGGDPGPGPTDPTPAGQLPDIITAGKAGSATKVPVIEYDAKGRLIKVSEATITHPSEGGAGNPSMGLPVGTYGGAVGSARVTVGTDGNIAGIEEVPIAFPPPAQGGGGGSTVINITGGNLPKPTNGQQLQALFDAAAQGKFVQRLAPGTHIQLDRTIVVKQLDHDGGVWGLDGGFAQIDWVGPAGQDMIRVEGVSGVANRGFVLINLQLYGGGYDRDPAGACLRIRCQGGDDMAYYKPTLQNIYTSYAQVGFVFEGAVFEFSHFNLHGENHRSHGMMSQSLGGAVMSNVFGIAPNMSRNGGSGIFTDYSHNIIMGSFILNSRYGVEAPNGLRAAAFNNGENTGESLFKLGGNGYGSVLLANEMSTGWVPANNFNLPTSGMSKFVLDGPASVIERDGHVATYNDADPHKGETRVRK